MEVCLAGGVAISWQFVSIADSKWNAVFPNQHQKYEAFLSFEVDKLATLPVQESGANEQFA